MGDFSADWLALRESVDSRARRAGLVERLADWLGRRRRPIDTDDGSLAVLDLGCGAGSNLRYLAPRLAALRVSQDWTCVDRDPELLAALSRKTAAWATRQGLEPGAEGEGLRVRGPWTDWRVRTLRLDLASGAETLPIGLGTLTVASALLDLVPEPWLLGLLQTGAAAASPMLLTLTYDGQVALEPQHPLDGALIGLVNAHQLRDKGMGPALGPLAPTRLARLATRQGYSVHFERSDWRLRLDQTEIQAALVEGWTAAALEQISETKGPVAARWAGAIREWRGVRMAHIAGGRSRMQIGHRDALLLPRLGQMLGGASSATAVVDVAQSDRGTRSR